jgi:hypothetical protein
VAHGDGGRIAPRGRCDLPNSRWWTGSSPPIRTTPAAACGCGFPSLSEEVQGGELWCRISRQKLDTSGVLLSCGLRNI